MDLKDFIAVRRAYSVARQSQAPSTRITFEELALLAYLSRSKSPNGEKTSELARYQNVLRPTMTHRTGHLAQAGFITRVPGVQDHRNICCQLSATGENYLCALGEELLHQLKADKSLKLASLDELEDYVIAVGRINVVAASMVLLALVDKGGQMQNMNELVSQLGLVQPTVSMAVASLVQNGQVARVKSEEGSARSRQLILLDAGRQEVAQLLGDIAELNIHESRGIYG